MGIGVKILAIGIGSLLIPFGVIELLIRPIRPMRRLFGMRIQRTKKETAKTAIAS